MTTKRVSDATGRVWLRVSTVFGCNYVAAFLVARDNVAFEMPGRCASCREPLADEHLHIYREFEKYELPASHAFSWGVCSEGCAMQMVARGGYTVIAQPEGVLTADDWGK